MGSICAEQHKFHPSHQLFFSKKTLRDIDIPPRKLLTRRAAAMSPETADVNQLQKFLPYNNGVDDDDEDGAHPYSSDHFRIYEFKIRRCSRGRSHDWTDCPFAHPGEKARRRDPRRYNYCGTACPEFRRGSCSRGDDCEFAHGVFEHWLHPTRYRTEVCKDGKNCTRKVCFFAHTPKQLRVLPSNCHENTNYSSPKQLRVLPSNCHENTNYSSPVNSHCCIYCRVLVDCPTSTLSPPPSPAKSRPMTGTSPISRFGDRLLNQFRTEVLSYKDAVTELMSSLEAMNVNEASDAGTNNRRLSWVDVNFNGDDQQQFILSPTIPSPSGSSNFSTDDNGLADPDIGWVNDLLK